MNGNWGSWSSWSSCTVTCGGGSQRRTGECDDPPPSLGGAKCPGSGEEVRSCNEALCPVLLVGGAARGSGNVFVVNRNGFYGPVCDDNWSDTAATVVCKYKIISHKQILINTVYGIMDMTYNISVLKV